MKIADILGVLLMVGIMHTACRNQAPPAFSEQQLEDEMHRQHSNLADNFAHKGIIVLDEPIMAPKDFGQVIGTFFDSYLNLAEALVKSDLEGADKAADEMKFVLGLIPAPRVKDVAVNAWKNHKEIYSKTLTEFLHAEDVDKKRSYFSHISETLYCTLKSFKIDGGDIHVAYCPMAFDYKGAYWLTDDHKIRNPYFGNVMPKCGKIVEIIQ